MTIAFARFFTWVGEENIDVHAASFQLADNFIVQAGFADVN
jgi:hypothetical protein